MPGLPVIVEAVAPQLLLFGHHIPVASQHVKLARLFVTSPVGINVIAAFVPDVGSLEEMSLVGIRIVHHRIALEFVLVVAHLDTIHTDNLVRISIIVAPVGFEVILAVGQHTASAESTDIVQRIEPEIVSIERRIPIDDLHQRSIDPRLVDLTVVVGPVAVNVCLFFIDQYVAEALDALVVVADRAVAGNDRPVVLGREMPYEHRRGRIAVRNGISPVGDEIDHLVRLGVLGRSTRSRRGMNTRNGNGQRPVPREDHTSGDTCDQQCAHYFSQSLRHRTISILPSSYFRTLRPEIRDRYKCTCPRSSCRATP